jgi:anti-anti-sigma factor
MKNNDVVCGFDDEKDENLNIRLQQVPGVEGCLVLLLDGYIDTYNSDYFQKRIKRAIDAGFIRLIFNCGKLNYVSSTGIGSFTSFLKTVKPRGGDLVLLEISSKVYEVIQLLGFSPFFNIKNSLDESVNFFGSIENDVIFPVIFPCPVCSRKLKAVKSGRFRCFECETILTVDKNGNITLG